ncbi:MAG TPA: NADH-ubiquinone oxidoreductase-F iron-sulfur binding region domain-containing protein [Candidatus Dormibacteraeota bacterium]|nr:NADH-ubiquinone oxidoreductase-F iron-sulfur binding region domain-containing protein [Candidatus Dormibacteraeota bacterium]
MSQATIAPPVALPWLLGGPPAEIGPEPLQDHLDRLGPCPVGGPDLLSALRSTGLRGRGGARFPAWRKWRAVRERSQGRAVVLVNGAEGEPASWKDRVLMAMRPHLVLDGAELAADTVGAAEVVLYVGSELTDARQALERAIQERGGRRWGRRRTRLVAGPPRYVAGEETAAVRFVDGGPARPTFRPPRPFERGVRGRPTLVQNVETLALVALLARFGPAWYRTVGTSSSPGPLLVTVAGAVRRPGVHEVPHGVSLGQVLATAEPTGPVAGVLLGGYFGAWLPPARAGSLALDDQALAEAGLGLGCGVVFALPGEACPLMETARVLGFLAHESAGQCGPCRYGLGAVADVAHRVAAGQGGADEVALLQRWAGQLRGGRGACRHPDGAVTLLTSALETFSEHLRLHLRGGACPASRAATCLPFPPLREGWR